MNKISISEDYDNGVESEDVHGFKFTDTFQSLLYVCLAGCLIKDALTKLIINAESPYKSLRTDLIVYG